MEYFFNMFRTVVWLVIMSLLTLNMAWASDSCALNDPSSSGTGQEQTLDPAPVDSTGAMPVCNQWCPGWTSFVTLPVSSVLLPSLLPTFEGGFDADPYILLPASPPTHPPIA